MQEQVSAYGAKPQEIFSTAQQRAEGPRHNSFETVYPEPSVYVTTRSDGSGDPPSHVCGLLAGRVQTRPIGWLT